LHACFLVLCFPVLCFPVLCFPVLCCAVLSYLFLACSVLTAVEQRRGWHCVRSHVQQPQHGNLRCEVAGQELGTQLACSAVCLFLCVSATQAESSWGWIVWNVVGGWLLDEMVGRGGECIGIGVMWCARVRIGEACSGSYGCLAGVRMSTSGLQSGMAEVVLLMSRRQRRHSCTLVWQIEVKWRKTFFFSLGDRRGKEAWEQASAVGWGEC
jgi:hypothetical protein